MHIVTVLPLAKNTGMEFLTYFTTQTVSRGMIVSVPLRKKTIDALVVDVRDASEEKNAVKGASFSLKKIIKVKGPSFIPIAFMESCEKLKDYYATTTGAIISTAISDICFKEYAKIGYKEEIAGDGAQGIVPDRLAYQAPREDRIAYYKTYIREAFARKASVMIMLPTLHDISIWKEMLSKGIEKYTITLHNEKTKKELLADMNRAITETHPVVILATPSFIFIPRTDLDTFIIEMESREAYKTPARPYLDFRILAELYSYKSGWKCIIGDTLLRPETSMRLARRDIIALYPPSFRLSPKASLRIIDMKAVNTMGIEKSFRIIDDEVLEVLKKNIASGRRSFIFSLRKGLAPTTVCGDCGETVLCPSCESPLVLYQKAGVLKNQGRIFICNHCRGRFGSDIVCKKCESWNLVPLGIGTERVKEYLEEQFVDAPIFILDRESASTHAQAKKIVERYYATEGAILVGTEMALYYLSEPVDTAIIASFDALFSIPSYRGIEKILHLMLDMEEITERKFIIQTRTIDHDIISAIKKESLLALAREEENDRKAFGYPPFMTLIKVVEEGKENGVLKTQAFLSNALPKFPFEKTISLSRRGAKEFRLSCLIKIPAKEWSLPFFEPEGSINMDFLSVLRALPPSCAIHINPENVL